jgi:hypothetical protein
MACAICSGAHLRGCNTRRQTKTKRDCACHAYCRAHGGASFLLYAMANGGRPQVSEDDEAQQQKGCGGARRRAWPQAPIPRPPEAPDETKQLAGLGPLSRVITLL